MEATSLEMAKAIVFSLDALRLELRAVGCRQKGEIGTAQRLERLADDFGVKALRVLDEEAERLGIR